MRDLERAFYRTSHRVDSIHRYVVRVDVFSIDYDILNTYQSELLVLVEGFPKS